MHNPSLRLTALGLIIASAALGGCSNTDEMDKLRADIQANRDAAARAQASAEDADHRSKEALNAANAANARIDRMFKKAMYK